MSSPHPDYQTFDMPYQNVGFDVEAHTKKSRSSCCCCGCFLGCLAALLLILFALFGVWYCVFSGGAPLIVSPETTIVTEPLKSDGKTVDFHQAIQALIEPGVQADENGFRVILLGYGQEMFVTGEHRWENVDDADRQYEEMCKTLEIDPQVPPTFSLFRLTPENIQQWLAEVGEGLDAVQAAAAKPHYFVPMIRQSEQDLVVMSQPLTVYAFHERLSDALLSRARIRSQEKDTAGAWKDRLTSMRLFRRVTINQAWLKALSSRNDDESLLVPVDEMVVTLPQWTPEQLEQAIKDLESLPDWQDRQTTLTMMHFMLLDLLSATNDLSDLQNRPHGKLPTDIRQAVEVLNVIAFDWNLVAKELNGAINAYGERLAGAQGRSPEEQFDQLGLRKSGVTLDVPFNNENKWERFLEDRLTKDMSVNPIFASGRSKLAGEIAGQLVTWVAGEMYRLQLMEESRCQTLRLALALERFYQEKGQYPDTLAELSLKPISPDMYLQYEKRGDGYRVQNKVFRLEK